MPDSPVDRLRIPKRIIQTGKQLLQPLKNRAAISSIRLWNPDFEYLFFDDAQVQLFVDRHFPQYRRMFDSYQFPVQRYDFFRYLAVYHLGGFYFDLDVFLASDLSMFLASESVFPFEGLTFSRFLRRRHAMDWQIGNYAFGASAKHPFLQAVIRNCVRAQEDSTWVKPMMRGMPALSKTEFLIMNTTGPGLLSRTWVENPELAEAVTILFPDDVCNPRNWNKFGDVGIHLMDGSWRRRNGFLRRRLANILEDWHMRRLLKQSLRLGKTRKASSGRRAHIAGSSTAEERVQVERSPDEHEQM